MITWVETYPRVNATDPWTRNCGESRGCNLHLISLALITEEGSIRQESERWVFKVEAPLLSGFF